VIESSERRRRRYRRYRPFPFALPWTAGVLDAYDREELPRLPQMLRLGARALQ
jgi:hypothetical protein